MTDRTIQVSEAVIRQALHTIAEWPCPQQDDMQAANMRKVAADALRSALRQDVQQPVAALIRWRGLTPASVAHDKVDHFHEWGEWEPVTLKHGLAVTDPARNDPKVCEMLPLYTTPPAAPARQALTEDEATALVQSVVRASDRPIGMVAYGLMVARATERRHGITKEDSNHA